MRTDRELMQMALDALENYMAGNLGGVWDAREASNALRDRLAQPEETPPFIEPMKLWLEVTTPPKSEWTRLIKGVRVDGDTVVIKTKNNEAARDLCAELITEKNT